MIVYLDASALVKRYVAETGSAHVDRLISEADAVGTAVISRAEVAAALGKAARIGALSREEAQTALQVFRTQWPDLVRLQLTELVMAQADTLAWDYGLRGYDAVHLAVARFWQSSLGEVVTLAAFDRQLWQSGPAVGLAVWPEDLEPFLHRAGPDGARP
ncbi:MAG: type II toxin-antitoxin system VapC family toxin [Anaerolineae bacterium]|nr:type II toxin-antitoxin system VapC family toxin [Anaerolineae bacterium]